MRPKPNRMTASKMDKRIRYRVSTRTQGDYNEPIDVWTDFATVWASVEPIRGREFFDSAQVNSEVTHRIRHLHLDGITPEMEITLGDRVFEILHFWRVDERNFEMEVLAKERLL